MPSCLIPTVEPPAGTSRLDHVFNFQMVVFEVENTLFHVFKNGFNIPGTPFEAMFALPQTPTDKNSIEGSSVENPIHLPGIKVDHFRSFLRILYPFMDQTPVVEFDEWVGVLNLATMWFFQEIREKAISKLSKLIDQKTLTERFALAREYRVAEWLRDAYLELTQETLWSKEPYSNWEADAKKCGALSKDSSWETLAKIFYLQAKVAASIAASKIFASGNYCYMECGGVHSHTLLCRCRLLPMVNEALQGELDSLTENLGHLEHPLPSNSTDSSALPNKKRRREDS